MIGSFVTGNLGGDARTGMAGDTPVVNFSVASRRYDPKAEGEKKEATDWVAVSFFGQRAEKIAKYLTKGSRVAVRGTGKIRMYTHNGEHRAELEVRADDVELLGKPDGAKAGASTTDEIPF